MQGLKPCLPPDRAFPELVQPLLFMRTSVAMAMQSLLYPKNDDIAREHYLILMKII